MAVTDIRNVTANGFEWRISGLSNPFNSGYYQKAVLTSSYTGSEISNPLNVVSTIYAGSSGVTYTPWTYRSKIGTANTARYYGYMQALNGVYYYASGVDVNYPVPTAPSMPTGLSLTTPFWNGSSYQLTFSWNSVPGATSYDVYKNGPLFYSSYSGTSILMSGLTGNTTYTFGVSARNAAGTSNANLISTTMPSPPDTTAPTINSFVVSDKTETSISCAWTASDNTGGSGISLFTLGLYRYSTETWIWKELSSNTTSYTFSGLIPSTKYQLAISATDNSWNTSQTTYIGDIWTLSDKFEWDYQKVSGQPFKVTASEWISFQNAINTKRGIYGLSNYSFTTPYSGLDFTATMFKQSVLAIDGIYIKKGTSSQVSSECRNVVKDDKVYAWYFENLKQALNNA